jgi:hypothetical protein
LSGLKFLDSLPAGGLRQAHLIGDLGNGHRRIAHQFGDDLAVDQVKVGHRSWPLACGKDVPAPENAEKRINVYRYYRVLRAGHISLVFMRFWRGFSVTPHKNDRPPKIPTLILDIPQSSFER